MFPSSCHFLEIRPRLAQRVSLQFLSNHVQLCFCGGQRMGGGGGGWWW